MKIKLLLCVLLFPLFLSANPCDHWSVEGRVAYLYPMSKKFRRIYPEGGADYQLEISRKFCNHWAIWANTSWFHKKGHSTGIHYRTRIDLIPVGIGLKKSFCLTECIDVYLGAGVNYTFLRLKNYSDFVKRHMDKEAFGGVIKSGVNYQVSEHIYAGLFIDYMIQRFNFHGHRHHVYRHDVNADAFKFGGNIGMSF